MDGLFDSVRTHIHELEIALRLALAGLFGAALGLDREIKNRPAGLRTHILTSLAAATFTILTIELYEQTVARGAEASADPIRIIEAVTAGVAFLAAGAIIQARGRVQGLTTGAAMWLAGAIGLACGVGYYTVALLATVLGLVVLTVVKWFERRLPGNGSSGEPDI